VEVDLGSVQLQEVPDIVKIAGLHPLHYRSQFFNEDFS
jgi:hypothetical protein